MQLVALKKSITTKYSPVTIYIHISDHALNMVVSMFCLLKFRAFLSYWLFLPLRIIFLENNHVLRFQGLQKN